MKRQKTSTTLNKKFIRQFCKSLKNIIHHKLSINKKFIPHLKKYRSHISFLILPEKQLSILKRKQILQKGGGIVLSSLLPILIATLPHLWKTYRK